ncbi:MAG: site-specific integrase [Rickettsiales bacterium]|nr:site-specific integrase [Pseudomonadota bacterium]MDA0965689.1 site-specific integrase [Pseudomonadota bacterium]MDG4543013.1 site-specific integrase [Rickettsiales bacterium]MDG4544539.1 site-specific integrase [Rickettsiales bacterium]MDG4546661.1 site-specific integrase [Rickettsiales bacterium]
MAQKFLKLTRPNLRKLTAGGTLSENGITFERLMNSDGRFTVNIMVDGMRVHRVIGKESEGVTREKAEEFINQARADARSGRLNLPKGRKTVFTLRRAVDEYIEKLGQEGGKDIHAKKRRLTQHVAAMLGDKPLPQISTFDIERFKKKRQEEGAKNGTINRDLAALSHLLSKAIEWKWINNKPCVIKKLKEEPSRIVYLTTEQAARLVEEAKHDQHPHLYPFIVIGLETGMRRMEILSIRVKNIDIDRNIIHIAQAKAGSREQPITSHLAGFLKGYIEVARPGQEWLFPSEASRTGHTVNIEKPFKRAVAAAGLDPKVIVRHTLRHTAITHLVQAGVDLPTVKRISGHKTLLMVERYSHQNGTHIQAAMDKLEERYRVKRP